MGVRVPSMHRTRLSGDAERANPVSPVHLWWSPPGSAVDLLVITSLSVYAAMHEESVAALPNETGGFLLGEVGWDERQQHWVVHVEDAVAVQPASQTPVHFTFTWRDVDRVRGLREERGKALVGWYHSHPDVGVFLSETDLDKTHRVLFSEPFQLALVYDPVRGRAGYFFWEGPQAIDSGTAAWREFDIVQEPDAVEDGVSQPPESEGALTAIVPAGASGPRVDAEAIASSFRDAAGAGLRAVPVGSVMKAAHQDDVRSAQKDETALPGKSAEPNDVTEPAAAAASSERASRHDAPPPFDTLTRLRRVTLADEPAMPPAEGHTSGGASTAGRFGVLGGLLIGILVLLIALLGSYVLRAW
jgi:proteasome lid subunit RPN8/RPN11